MSDASHVLGIVDLVQGDLLGADVLNMPDSAIGEDMPFDLQLSKNLRVLRECAEWLLESLSISGHRHVCTKEQVGCHVGA